MGRTVAPCLGCGRSRPVQGYDAQGRPQCCTCRLKDPARWEPCGRCGTLSAVWAREDGVAVGRCCYVRPFLRCTVCGVRKGVRPHKTRRPVCALCAEGPRAVCATCGLDAPVPEADAPACCARCKVAPPLTCSGCGAPTIIQGRDGTPRCEDCYQRPVAPCGRCGRVRVIVRFATGSDPDLCGVCWRGPVMTCEGCGRVCPCRGERKGMMLCARCRPVRPQPCSHCGRLRSPTAQWAEGPVCGSCYQRALAAKATCPACGQHRRLLRRPGDGPAVCADCIGVEPTHVCSACGVEDALYDKGLCPRCSLVGRLTALLGEPHQRARLGLEPLFVALSHAPSAKAVLDWLVKSKRATGILARMGRGELACSHEALDSLPDSMVVRHLEHLLVATGALPDRDPILAGLERWVDDFLDKIDDPDTAKLLRPYANWKVLWPLRAKSERSPLTEGTGYGARDRLKSAAMFLTWLGERGRTPGECRQVDVDAWMTTHRPHRTKPVRAFVMWAMARGAMPRLDYPNNRGLRVAPAIAGDDRWAVARRLLHEPGLDPADRVAGALVVIYAQPVSKISRLRLSDVATAAEGVRLRLGTTLVTLPEPLAGHVRELVARRRSPAKARLPQEVPWLFPGRAPGRPFGEVSLAARLRRLGIEPSRARQVALFQLSAELPAAVVADLLGVHITTATAWARIAGRDWAGYAATRAKEAGHG